MSPQIPTRGRWRAKFARPQCEQLEERLALALFNVQTPLSFSGLSNNGCVAVADLNKDGRADAILANFGTDYGAGAATTITVLYGQSGGGFSRVNLSTGGQNVSFVSIADINGDSWPDALVTNQNHENTGSVSVFRNDGAGNLILTGTPFSTFSNDPNWVGLSDLTGDGILDAIVASPGKDDGFGNVTGNKVTIFQGIADAQGHGNFTFSSSPVTTLAPSIQFIPTTLAIADFDGDGLKDIAATVPSAPPSQPQQQGFVWLFRGNGSGGFASPNQFDSGGAVPIDVKAANLNGDNKPDLVVANAGDFNANPEFSGNSIGMLLNVSTSGSINFGTTNSWATNCYGTFAVAVADFNQDGKQDIAAVNYGSAISLSPAAFVSVYMGNGTGGFTLGSPGTYDTQTGVGGGQYLAVGDFDANGTPDLIVAHASNKVGLLLNTTSPPYTVTWTGSGDGTNWTDPMNWSTLAVPSSTNDVTISVAWNPTIQLTTGTQSIRSLSCDENLTIAGGTLDVAQSSQVTGNFALASGSLIGNGDLRLNNATNSWTGGSMSGSGKTIIAAGATLTLSGVGARTSSRGFQVDGQVNVSSGGATVPVISALVIGASGKFNLADNAMIVDYSGPSPIATLGGYVSSGYAGGAWNGFGINSSLAAATPGRALGYAEATDLYSMFPAVFVGQTVDNTSVLFRYTLNGDADLNRSVDTIDFNLLAANFSKMGRRWSQGDFDYNAAVDTIDFNLLAANFSKTLTPSATAAPTALDGASRLPVGVFSQTSAAGVKDDPLIELVN